MGCRRPAGSRGKATPYGVPFHADRACRAMRISSANPLGKPGGAYRDRTDDLKLAKLALSQLS